MAGSSSSIPRPNRACSSYLIEDGEHNVVLDMGTGAFSNLRTHLEYDKLQNVVITHMHADHFLDLIPLRYALRYGERSRSEKVRLFLPPKGEKLLRSFVSNFGNEVENEFLKTVFDVEEYDPKRVLSIGSATLRFAPTIHYIPTYAVRYDHAHASLTYSADTAPSNDVVELATGSTIFLCEATLRDGEAEAGVRGHASPEEAGEMAHSARVERLVLTHYHDADSIDDMRAQAGRKFEGFIGVADDNLSIEL